MLKLNDFMFTGRLTSDPETRTTKTGIVVSCTVAIDNSYKKDGEWVNEATFMAVKAFDKTADPLLKLEKGNPVYVSGALKTERWEKDGQKHSKVVVTARMIRAMDKTPETGQYGDSRPTSRPSDGVDFNPSTETDDVPF